MSARRANAEIEDGGVTLSQWKALGASRDGMWLVETLEGVSERLTGEINTGNEMPSPFGPLNAMRDDKITGALEGLDGAGFSTRVRVATYTVTDCEHYEDTMWKGATLAVAHVGYDRTILTKDLCDEGGGAARTLRLTSYHLVSEAHGTGQRKDDQGNPVLALRMPDVLARALSSGASACNGRDKLYPVVFTVNSKDARSRGGPDGCIRDHACVMALFDSAQLRWLVRVDMPYATRYESVASGAEYLVEEATPHAGDPTDTPPSAKEAAQRRQQTRLQPDEGSRAGSSMPGHVYNRRAPNMRDVHTESTTWDVLATTTHAFAVSVRWVGNQRTEYGVARAVAVGTVLRRFFDESIAHTVRDETHAARVALLSIAAIDAVRDAFRTVSDEHLNAWRGADRAPETLDAANAAESRPRATFDVDTIARAMDPQTDVNVEARLPVDADAVKLEAEKWAAFAQAAVASISTKYTGHILHAAANHVTYNLVRMLRRGVSTTDEYGAFGMDVDKQLAPFHNAVFVFASLAHYALGLIHTKSTGGRMPIDERRIIHRVLSKPADGIASTLSDTVDVTWTLAMGDDADMPPLYKAQPDPIAAAGKR